jgi:ABC-type phosphate transport system substrate-binding protein
VRILGALTAVTPQPGVYAPWGTELIPMRSALAFPALSLALLSAATLTLGQTRGYVVVVNESNPKASIATADLARVFMKTVKRWDDGRPVEPIDQSFESPIRAQFSRAVLGKTAGQVQEFWLRETYSGHEIPPPVRSSDAAVLEFVRGNPGAIGYVAAGASLPSGVKALTVNP